LYISNIYSNFDFEYVCGPRGGDQLCRSRGGVNTNKQTNKPETIIMCVPYS